MLKPTKSGKTHIISVRNRYSFGKGFDGAA
jgi:hypothetical protein